MVKFRKIITSGIFTLGMLFIPGVVLAATDIDVDFPDPPGPIITETNILPGNVFTRTVTITKLNDADKALMLRLDRKNTIGSYNLESKILMKIQRLSDNAFLDMPNTTKEDTLENFYKYTDAANSDAYKFDTISGLTGSEHKYKFWFTFDPSTGNEYQGKSTTFDILMGIYTTTVDEDDEDDGDGHHNNNDGGGGNPAPAFAFFGTGGTTGGEQGQTQGIETNEEEEQGGLEGGQNQEVAGEVTTCRSWPLWAWILAIVIFTLNFWRNARKNYKAEKYKWIYPLAWTIIAVVFWYYFDKCREFVWFWKSSIGIAIVSHFVYLYFLKKKVRRGMPIEKGEVTGAEDK